MEQVVINAHSCPPYRVTLVPPLGVFNDENVVIISLVCYDVTTMDYNRDNV